MQNKLSGIINSYKHLLRQQRKLQQDINDMGAELDNLKQKIIKLKRIDSHNKTIGKIPKEIHYDVDDELDRFLKNTKIQDSIKKLNKSYMERRFNSYIPLGMYGMSLVFSTYLIYGVCKHMGNCKSLIMIVIILLGYAIASFTYKKMKLDLNDRLVNDSHYLSQNVKNLLTQGGFNAEYLSYLLTQRIQERHKLDLQFDKIIKIISYVIKLSLIFEIFVETLSIFLSSKIHANDFIFWNICIIIVVIIIGMVIDAWNYHVSDAYYFRRQRILDAVMKYKIEHQR